MSRSKAGSPPTPSRPGPPRLAPPATRRPIQGRPRTSPHPKPGAPPSTADPPSLLPARDHAMVPKDHREPSHDHPPEDDTPHLPGVIMHSFPRSVGSPG